MPSFRSDHLTWAGLLAKWVEFAQASLALPDDAAGRRWRESVPHIINLQAVTFALADLASLPASEQHLALDKSEIIIRDAARAMEEIWSMELPESIGEIIADAHAARDAASALIDLR